MTHGPYFFTMRRDPECPYCRQTLLPVATDFVDATAFCHTCSEVLDHRTIRQILATQEDDLTKGAWSTSRGLLWFTPHTFMPNNYAAHFLPAVIAAKTPADDELRDNDGD